MNYNEKIDYSSLSTYLDCPRKFLFKYVMHMRSNRQDINLVFGSCWHYGMEVVYKEMMEGNSLTVTQATEMSISAFNHLWSIEGTSFDEDQVFPKSPGNAANMYHAYWKQFMPIDAEKTVVAVESPFTLNLSHIQPGLPNYIGRLDLAFRTLRGTLEIVDHKTCKALYPMTLPGFDASFQTDGYLTAGDTYFDQIPTMVYSMAVCQKTKIAFHRYEILKNKSHLERFLNDVIYHVGNLQKDINLMEYERQTLTEKSDYARSFPRRSGYACTTYMSVCQYFDLCKMRPNPLLWHGNPPGGYTVNEWDPDTHESEMRKKLGEAQ